MNSALEDTLGDIVKKARISTQIAAEKAAAAAGLDLEAYMAWERTGIPPSRVDWDAISQLLTLDGERLCRQAHGWLPADVDLTQWRHLQRFTTHGNSMDVHAYLAWDEATREAALFDTGFDATQVLAAIESIGLNLLHLFITHTHIDHIAALAPIRQKHPKLRLHSSSPNAPVSQRNRPNDFIPVGNLRISFRPTQGHADDGATYIIGNWPEDAPLVAIVGDAIFAGSMGGAREKLSLARNHVQEQILSLPAETLICPGHGPMTNVGQEAENNPWFTKGQRY